MHARVNTAQVQPDQIDDIVKVLESIAPRLKEQSLGLETAWVLADRGSGKLVVVSRWVSEAAGDAAEPVYQEAMRELGRFMADPPIRERYELLFEV